MQAIGLPPGLSGGFTAEELPRAGTALWLVRNCRSGTRRWLLASDVEADPGLSTATHILRTAPASHLAPLDNSGAESGASYVCMRWQGERPLASALVSPARERAALQLLDSVHMLQALPEPVALPGLNMAQVLVMPLTGYLRLADLSGAVHNASIESLQSGRQACGGVLRELLSGAGEAEQELLAAWENDGAEVYPALRAAVQRLQLAALAADF